MYKVIPVTNYHEILSLQTTSKTVLQTHELCHRIKNYINKK